MQIFTENEFYGLLSRKLSGEASSEELALLNEQLAKHPEWQFLHDQMIKALPELSNDQDAEQAYASHFVKMKLAGMFEGNAAGHSSREYAIQPAGARRFRAIRMAWISVAAVAACTLLVVVLQNFRTSKKAHDFNEIVTKKGSKSRVTLPDGTLVWLNADSRLCYAGDFDRESREVSVVGEAYFDVARDTRHPFILHAGRENITVLGTSFNVRNYPSDSILETTLVSGKIEITVNDLAGEKIILHPQEKFTLSNENIGIFRTGAGDSVNIARPAMTQRLLVTATRPVKDSLFAETAWVSDKMIFVNEPLEKIARELERHFDISVVFLNPTVKSYRYTGSFDNASLDKILEVIRQSKKINYTISGKDVIMK